MSSQGIILDNSEDNRERERSQLSLRSIGKESERLYTRSRKREKRWDDADSSPGDHNHDHELERDSELDRARTRTKEPPDSGRDPDRDRMSDGEGSSGSFYSDDYEKLTPSEHSISPGSASASPRRRPARARKVSNSPLHRAGQRKAASRPLRPGMQHAPHRWGGASLGVGARAGGSQRCSSLTKEPPARDLDLVTKRLLSARLLKIHELKNAFAEQQQQTDELRRENRLLRQLQLRHEKALNRYSDTESEIAQLLARHNNETAALRERLRRSQERLRAAERGQRDADERHQRSERELQKLRRLADDQRLGEREELTRRLEASQQRAQESDRKVKDLERNMELSKGSFQRQLAGERRRTHETQEELRTLQEEVERLTLKLKEKERELDTRNIYANRMRHTPSSRKDTDSAANKKVPSRSNSKAVQTEDRALSLDFPSPPPALTDGSELTEHGTDNYLSLKELWNGEQTEPKETSAAKDRERERERERERDREWEKERARERERIKKEREEREREEKKRLDQELNTLEEKAKRLRDDALAFQELVLPDLPSAEGAAPDLYELKHWEKEDGTRNKPGLSIHKKEEENRKRQSLIQKEEVKVKDAESPTSTATNQEKVEEESHRKQLLLAKMREIDEQNQGGDPDRFFSDSAGEPAPEPRPSSRVSEPRNQNLSIFSFTEPAESVSLWGGSERVGGGGGGGSGGVGGGEGATGGCRGTLRGSQKTSEDDGVSFGSYAPSFGRPSQRAGLTSTSTSTSASRVRPEVSPKPVLSTGLDPGLDLGVDLGGGAKDRKSNLLQQLFGSPPDSAPPPSKMEVLSPPPNSKPPLSGMGGRRRDTESPPNNGGRVLSSSRSTLHVAESRPTVRAITSFDDDIEELTL